MEKRLSSDFRTSRFKLQLREKQRYVLCRTSFLKLFNNNWREKENILGAHFASRHFELRKPVPIVFKFFWQLLFLEESVPIVWLLLG
jgi:hypothetical protein